jgi:hypothetical protein
MSKRGHKDDRQSKLQKNDIGLKVVDDSEYCPICQDVLGHENIFTTDCLHKFHNECINTWTQKPESQPKDHDKTQFRCPLCNQSTPRRGDSQQLPPQQSVNNNPRFNRVMDFFRNQREESRYREDQDRIFASADELHAGLQAASLLRKENRQSRRDAGEENVEEDTPPVDSDDDDEFYLGPEIRLGGKSRKGLRKNNRRKTRKVKRRKSKKR